MLDFIKASLKSEGINATKKDLNELLENITKLKNSPYEQQLFTLFDWQSWAESKIKETSLKEVMQKNNKTQSLRK